MSPGCAVLNEPGASNFRLLRIRRLIEAGLQYDGKTSSATLRRISSSNLPPECLGNILRSFLVSSSSSSNCSLSTLEQPLSCWNKIICCEERTIPKVLAPWYLQGGIHHGRDLTIGIRTLSTEGESKKEKKTATSVEDDESKKDKKTATSVEDGESNKDKKTASNEPHKQHRSTKIDGGKKYSVVQIDSDGLWRTVARNAAELGIHPRDVDVLATANPFISQRSTIEVHNEKIMVRMENVRALLYKNHVLLFEARRPRSFKHRAVVGAAPSIAKSREKAEKRARELFAVYMSQQAREPIDHPLDAMPFHLRMLECMLDDTSSFFYQKAERLKVVVERMLEELTDDVNMGGLQRLLPLKRALTEVEHDVWDTHLALEQVLASDEILEAICLNTKELHWPFPSDSNSGNGDPQQPTLRQAAADMILTYQRQIDNAGGALEELRKNMDATQEIWELGLDTTRNRIIQIDLLFSLGTLALSASALAVGYFGMNLPSGLEENPRAFWWVVAGTVASTIAIAGMLVFVVRIWPRVMDRRRAQDLAGLRDLLQHLDDIDDIFQAVAREVAGNAVTREEFKRILHSHPSAKFMRQGEIDLMFRMFDVDRDGFLEETDFEAKKDEKRDRESNSSPIAS